MSTRREFRNLIAAGSIALAMLACQAVTGTQPAAQVPVEQPATLPPAPAFTQAPAVTQAPAAAAEPIPGLAGYWQDGMRVFSIAWQNDKYEVTGFNVAGTANPEILSQSWDGSTLTWTYRVISAFDAVTMAVQSVNGDRLSVNWSVQDGDSGPATLRRAASSIPEHDALPHMDDFTDPGSSWEVYEYEFGSVKYGDGYYSVRSIKKDEGVYGYAYRYFSNPVISFDATPVIGPASNSYQFGIECNVQPNGDGYGFEIDATGYYYIGKYTNNGDDYQSLFSGDDFRASNAIHSGKASNHVVATCANGKLKLELNGTTVWEGSDYTWSDGDIGLGVYGWEDAILEYHFENLIVTTE